MLGSPHSNRLNHAPFNESFCGSNKETAVKSLLKMTFALAVAMPIGCGQGQVAKQIAQQEAKQEAKTEVDRLEGTWTVVSIEENDKKAFEEKAEKPVWIIRNWAFGAPQGQKTPVHGAVFTKDAQFSGLGFHSLNPETSPKSLVASTPGGHGGLELPGIYKFEGDRLTICHASWGSNKRPTEFAAKPGCRLIVLSLVSHERDAQVEKFLDDMVNRRVREKQQAEADELELKSLTAKPALVIPLPTGRLGSVAFSPDGKQIATAVDLTTSSTTDVPGEVKLWDAVSGKEVALLTRPKGTIGVLAFSPNGKYLAATHRRGKVAQVWDATTGEQSKQNDANRDWLVDIAFNPAGDLLAISGGNVIVWDFMADKIIHEFNPVKVGRRVLNVAFAADGKSLAAAADDGATYVWDVQSGQEVQSRDRFLRTKEKLWPLPPGKEAADYLKQQHLMLSPNGQRMVTSKGKVMTISDTNSGKEILKVPFAGPLSFTADGQRLAQGTDIYYRNAGVPRSGGDEVKIWDLSE
jgi:uncharacterized protein (TIGR03067 family)